MPEPLLERIGAGDEVFVLTGATGWFGTAALHILDLALGESFGERVFAYAATGRPVDLRSGRVVEVRPLSDLPRHPPTRAPVCLLHFAYLMRHLAAELGHDEFVRRNRTITDTTKRALEAVRPMSFAFVSSGAVYRSDGGIVDDLEHEPYATLKHRDELTFEQACAALGTRCIIGRVYSVGGPFMRDRERFVLGDLVDRTLAGESIVIRTRQELWRSYVGLGDVLAAFLAEALDGTDPVVRFDTGGEPVEAADLARRVRKALGASEVAIVRDLDPALAPDRYVGDGARFEQLARRHRIPLTSLDEQIRQVALA